MQSDRDSADRHGPQSLSEVRQFVCSSRRVDVSFVRLLVLSVFG